MTQVVHPPPPATAPARSAAAPPVASTASTLRRAWDRVPRELTRPVDIAPLVVFRVAMGAIMLWEVWRYFDHDWIWRYWIQPTFHFRYHGFEWVRPWPGDGMYHHFLALGVLAVLVMVGAFYRVSATLFFLGFTYAFLLEQARYLNHFYLISLVSFLMIVVPAHRALSVDAWRNPRIRSDVAPAWALWALRAQIGLVFFFGGIAKLNPDWLRGEPMRAWLAERADRPLLAPVAHQEWFVYLFSYGGLLLDLLIVPLLLWRKTRPYAFAAGILFHLTNAWLFRIGIFPWFMIAATLLFFPPETFARLLRGRRATAVESRVTGSAETAHPARGAAAVPALLAVFFALQLLLPLRHLLYPGDVNWTEEGHRFSWHMKLRDKEATALFVVRELERGRSWTVDPLEYLPAWQARKLSTRPDMILQFSHHLADLTRRAGYRRVEVRALVTASLNGREPQWLVDPEVDLAREPRSLRPASWIVPLTQPLRPSPHPPGGS